MLCVLLNVLMTQCCDIMLVERPYGSTYSLPGLSLTACAVRTRKDGFTNLTILQVQNEQTKLGKTSPSIAAGAFKCCAIGLLVIGLTSPVLQRPINTEMMGGRNFETRLHRSHCCPLSILAVLEQMSPQQFLI